MGPASSQRLWLERLSVLKQARPRAGSGPHKPLLLLVVLDPAEEGKLDCGLMVRDGSLAFRFSSYWTIIAYRRSSRPDLRLPFYPIAFGRVLDATGRR